MIDAADYVIWRKNLGSTVFSQGQSAASADDNQTAAAAMTVTRLETTPTPLEDRWTRHALLGQPTTRYCKRQIRLLETFPSRGFIRPTQISRHRILPRQMRWSRPQSAAG